MPQLTLTLVLSLLAWGPLPETDLAATPDTATEAAQDVARPLVQVAICLDTSGSMQGLIDAARQKLWTIVNDLALAEPVPDLRIALVSFGNDGYDAENGWVRVLQPFTEDLDRISEELFGLSTNGGTELVGRAIDRATTELAWDPSNDVLKVLFVAGNESADQDRDVPYAEACKKAIARGVLVNSIYCGDPLDEIAPGWRHVASLADGHYAAIDHNEGTIVIETPFDVELATFSSDINRTYVPYGQKGVQGRDNQVAQDSNAAGLNGAAAAARCQSKGGSNYNCGSWDLVDATGENGIELATVKEGDLPEEMRSMSLEERQRYIDDKRKARQDIRDQIEALSKKRTAFLDRAMAEAAAQGKPDSFDLAIRRAVREQASGKGFRFTEIAAPVEETGAPGSGAAPLAAPIVPPAPAAPMGDGC